MLRRTVKLQRQGISLFEVLISILVASIGVFGVLILIPFAVRNAEDGIAVETAIETAKNYQSDLEAMGYHNRDNWIDDDWNPEVTGANAVDEMLMDAMMPSNQIPLGRPVIIDPLSAVANETRLGTFGQFPTAPGLPPDLPLLNIVSLLDPASLARMDQEIARRLTSSRDDLVFKSPDQELNPPRQAYFTAGTIGPVKRQYEGRYSAISIAIPSDDTGKQYRLVTIVGKIGDRNNERVFEVIAPGAASGAPDTMRVFRTDTGAAGTRQYEQIALGGGDLRLSEIPTPGQPPLKSDRIRNGDWLILLSHFRDGPDPPDPGSEPLFNDISIGTYKVISGDRETPSEDLSVAETGCVRGAGPERTFTVTVQGADFDLCRDWVTLMDGETTQVPTYAILLPNVLAVYERTIRAEELSKWNMSF